MRQIQLLLEKWQHQRLRAMAKRQGRSLSELVREILTQHLEPWPPGRRPGLATIEGAGDDPVATGRQHHRFLYDDVRQESAHRAVAAGRAERLIRP